MTLRVRQRTCGAYWYGHKLNISCSFVRGGFLFAVNYSERRADTTSWRRRRRRPGTRLVKVHHGRGFSVFQEKTGTS
jgi:hypothetical protein